MLANALTRRRYVVMKFEEHKDEDWAKKVWEDRKKQKSNRLVKFSNAAGKSIGKVKVCTRNYCRVIENQFLIHISGIIQC